MTSNTTSGRKPKFDDDDVADAIADLRSNNTPLTPTAISTWLNEAGIAKSPNSEALKKSVQRVLDREKEQEKRRLLAALPSWVTEQLDPGIEQITTLLHLLMAKVHEEMKKSTERSTAEANASIRLRDNRISALEDNIEEAGKKLTQSTEELDRANEKLATLDAERQELRAKVLELTGAKTALEAVVASLRPDLAGDFSSTGT